MTDFVHLHVHTEYSLLDGACRIGPMMAHLKAMGQTAVAITDHGVMYGVIDFYRAAKDAGLKPIIGCELYVSPRGMTDKTYELDSGAYHLVALCKNETGYKNLIYLCSQGFIQGFYTHPRVDYDLLSRHSEGLILLSACLAGEVQQRLMEDNYGAAKECALKYSALMGPGNYYLELQDHGIPEQQKVNTGLLKLAQETGLPLVATNDAHYTRREDSAMHDVLLCIQTGKNVDDENRMRFHGDQFYLKSGEEMASLFSYAPEAIANTKVIADQCNVDFVFGQYHLPRFQLPEGEADAPSYLRKLAEAGFERRYENPPEEIRERLHYELDMINNMGFTEYFLIVWDFIDFARRQGIPVGPGRGSGAGSIVAYSLRITDVDPIRYNLIFERFLNPERISMPDFDIDFCPNRRQEVIDYVTEKYGHDHVAQIITFGTMAARAAVRDTGRALNMPYAEVDVIAKLIPQELKITLDKALETSPDLKLRYDSDERVHKLIDMARQLEGMPRNASTHAAGVIIAAAPVWEYVPLATGDQGVVTQFTMVTLEELGLLKMDFLGLRNLTIIDDAIKLINASGKLDKPIDLDKLDYDDQHVFDMLGRGQTSGVFQMESGGMTGVAVGLKPHSVEDLTAIVALFRPGPMQSIPLFIDRKHHPERVTYKHSLLEPILSVTYGCIVYQEQVMEVFRQLAGYSMGQADMVRRAMSKKKFDVLAAERENFVRGNAAQGITGCASRGVSEQVANEIFDEMLDFASYAFNKAHAVCYGVLAYQTAYLKYHYPHEYMAALLTSVLGSTSKVSEYIAQCRELGITVLPPDINASRADFAVDGASIRFGIGAVKNVGVGFIERLVAQREENGPFLSFGDFCDRMADNDLNKRVLESLIRCGAFDSLGHTRFSLITVYPGILESAASDRRRNLAGQINLFADLDEPGASDAIPDLPEYPKRELLAMERETTGLYLSGHPMESLMPLAKQVDAVAIAEIMNALEEGGAGVIHDGAWLAVAGVIASMKIKVTKKNTSMAYVTLEDMTGSMELLVFERVLNESGAYLKGDEAVIAYGRVSAREDEEPKLICDDIHPLTSETASGWKAIRAKKRGGGNSGRREEYRLPPREEAPPQKLYLRVPSLSDPLIDEIAQLLEAVPGKTRVIIKGAPEEKAVGWSGGVTASPWLLENLGSLLGEPNVVYQ